MKLIVFVSLLIATLVARATCITNVEFYNQIRDKGDVEDLDTYPDNVDDDTIVLTGYADDELDEDYLTKALALETASRGEDEVSDGDLEEVPVPPVDNELQEKVDGVNPWVRVRVRVRFWRRRRSVQDQRDLATTSSRCKSKSIIVNLDQPKKITQTFCLRLTRLSKTSYHARLVQDEHLIFDDKFTILGKFRDICVPFRSASNLNACMYFRLQGSSVCASVAADFWSRFKTGVDFGCMESGEITE